MTALPQVLKIRRPDDWHIHLRDGEMLKTVVPYTSQTYGRAIVRGKSVIKGWFYAGH